MGKNKDKYKGGSNSVFASYMANLPSEGTNSGSGNRETPLPDNMKASTLLEQIGTERSWLEDQINLDLAILESNRIYTVGDLRFLSRDSWKQIEFLPIVKDLIREAISRNLLDPDEAAYEMKKAEKRARKELKKQEKKSKKERKEREKSMKNSNKNLTNFNKNIKGINEDDMVVIRNKEKNGSDSYSSSSSESSSDSDSESVDSLGKKASSSSFSINNVQQTVSAPPYSFSSTKPVKQIVGNNRLRIRAPNGRTYEVDRYCPHKNADLLSRGAIVGNKLICTKHEWEYSLDQGGKCARHGATINACAVNDW
ncbi:1442_t:CDS:2 [Ambispora gerdemannii]|uniref:1442_t:CDS:1 n=1 Tax=Ambispora gerdemannii TaxID=144530 RepID=A0A9N8V4E7_9GLOM|nr:1442_t:CDS:2 [Ambispora gerdemannii]